MNKKNDKRLCWNCDGGVSHHIAQCPFCGVDLSKPISSHDENDPFKGFASPFQAAPNQDIPQPPYARASSQSFTPADEEWNQGVHEEKERQTSEEDVSHTTKREMIALLLLLPGVVFFLFGLVLILFSHDGVLSLSWNQNVAYFYFMGAIPLMYLGWRALR